MRENFGTTTVGYILLTITEILLAYYNNLWVLSTDVVDNLVYEGPHVVSLYVYPSDQLRCHLQPRVYWH